MTPLPEAEAAASPSTLCFRACAPVSQSISTDLLMLAAILEHSELLWDESPHCLRELSHIRLQISFCVAAVRARQGQVEVIALSSPTLTQTTWNLLLKLLFRSCCWSCC